MRLLHTSDWHLGKATYNVSRRPDHVAIAAEIAAIAREHRPDLILHTGDLFDVSMPSVDDMRLGIDMLDELAAIAPVVVVCGNHENPKLFELFQKLRGSERLRFVDKPRTPANGGIFEYPTAAGERIRLAALPFVRNSTFIAEFVDPGGWSSVYADRLKRVEDLYADALALSNFSTDVPVFAAHLFVTGAKVANSEREIHVDDYATRPDAIPAVSYAAFGHIHKPQEIGGRSWARYAGSPIQIDFGEVGEQKSVVFVEAKPGMNARVQTIPLRGGRPLAVATGTLAEIERRASDLRGSLVRVKVHEKGDSLALTERVQAILAGATILTLDAIDPRNPAVAVEVARDGGSEPDMATLFAEFVASKEAIHGADEVRDLFERVLQFGTDDRAVSLDELLEVPA